MLPLGLLLLFPHPRLGALRFLSVGSFLPLVLRPGESVLVLSVLLSKALPVPPVLLFQLSLVVLCPVSSGVPLNQLPV